MKWIGQKIWCWITRFRNDVYLEDVADHGADPDRFLTMDSSTGKVTYRTGAEVLSDIGAGSGDITGVTLTDDEEATISDTAGSADFIIAGGSGITTSGSSATMTIAGDDASTSAKGVASFASANFAASSGAISIKSGGVDLTDEVTDTLTVANGGTGNTIGSLIILSAGNGYLSTITADEWYFGNNSYGHTYHNWNNVKAAITAHDGTFTMSEDYNQVGRLTPVALSKVTLQVSARPSGGTSTDEVLSVCIVSADRDGAGTNTTWTVLAQGTITQVQGEYDGVDVTYTGAIKR